MDDGPQRIEIELTEHAGARSRRWRRRSEPGESPARAVPPARGSDAVASSPVASSGAGAARPADAVVTHGPEPTPPASDRGRLVATGLTVGLVALVIGWALGRAGDDRAAQTVDATSTRDRTATTAAGTILPGETLPAASVPTPARPVGPTTSRPPRTTTTTLPAFWAVSAITVDPRLADTTDRIVAIGAGPDRALIDLDLAAGVLRTLEVRGWPAAQTPYPPVAGDDWIAVQFDDGSNPFVLRGDGTVPTRLTVSDPWSLYWDLTSDSVWVWTYDDSRGRPEGMVEVSLEGTPTGRTIPFSGFWPSLPDPAGGLVVSDGSGIFSVGPDGSARIAEGRVVAMGTGHVLSFACGDTIDDCGFRLKDRGSGEWRPVPTELADPYEGWWGGLPQTAMVTPDGAAALLVKTSDRGMPYPVVLDTVTGEMHDFGRTGFQAGTFPYPSAVWSNDGRWAFTVVDTVLVAYDRTTGETFPVSDELPAVSSVTVRPAG